MVSSIPIHLQSIFKEIYLTYICDPKGATTQSRPGSNGKRKGTLHTPDLQNWNLIIR